MEQKLDVTCDVLSYYKNNETRTTTTNSRPTYIQLDASLKRPQLYLFSRGLSDASYVVNGFQEDLKLMNRRNK